MILNKPIKILNWNACSLKANENELFNFLTVNNVHIAIITKTYLKPNMKLKYDPKYVVHRNDRIQGSGETKVIETLGVEVQTELGILFIAAAYLPFQCTREHKNYFKGDLQKLTRNRSKFFIIGDFNAKHRSWNNSRSNSNGKILFNDCSSGYYSILSPNSPTCFSSLRNPSVFNYNKANWERYKTHIERNFNNKLDLQNEVNIDSALEALKCAIVDARNYSVPKAQLKFDSPIIDENLQLLIRLKNVRRRQYQRSRDPVFKTIFKDLQKEIKHRFTLLRNQNFETKVEKLKPYSKPFRKLSKMLKKPSKPIPVLKDGERFIVSNEQKAQRLAQQFESVHNSNLNFVSPIENKFTRLFDLISSQNILPEEIIETNLNEIKSIIKNFKSMKAPGDDGIFNILIKHLPESTMEFLVKIFNCCFEIAYFPKLWKNAKITPILKPDKNPAEV
ncbi:RNA-directed DNA polymerase from mobile element jockey isoform X1 [Wyeomyia smithii]|uniref:RNA-directed DNA polymerase from mobile element jockey isoform X1 n=1 Tax=Wyeomyia smithii TaxID=174621 RepID=UPI002467F9C3|nr:RNA-directed DNA polymerase from mobile element jockey isoform X1 [Wyeomyia smithii]